MFLSSMLVQGLIIFGVVVLFLGSILLNRKVQAPKGTQMPDKCLSCPSKTCIIRLDDVEKKKEEIKKYLEECEENNEGTEKK